MKKEYAKPYLIAQAFEPQEYCAPCTKPSVTTLNGWSIPQFRVYIDLNGDDSYQKGESFQLTGVSFATIQDQVTKSKVGIYYFALPNGNQINQGLGVGDNYEDFEFKQGSITYQMKLKTISTETIIIKDGAAFVKNQS